MLCCHIWRSTGKNKACVVGVYILIAAGALMMVVGFFGCCGAIQESPCMLGLVIPTPFLSQILLSSIMRWTTLVFECFSHSSSSFFWSYSRLRWLLEFGGFPTRPRWVSQMLSARTPKHTVPPIYVNIFVPVGYWRYNEFLQGNIQKLSRHQTGSSEKNTPSHPAWSKISSLSPYFSKMFA